MIGVWIDKKKGRLVFEYIEALLKELTILIPAPGGQHAIRVINGYLVLQVFGDREVFEFQLDIRDFEVGPKEFAESIALDLLERNG